MVWLSPDERLDQDALAVWRRAFNADAGLDALVADVVRETPRDGSDAAVAMGSLDDLVKDATAADGVLVLRRDAWLRLGGFDERLPALAVYEFLLRSCEGGARYQKDRRNIVRTTLRRQSAAMRAADWDARRTALRQIVASHRPTFITDLGRAPYQRQRVLDELRRRNHALMGQRSHAIAESEALSARIQSLSAELPPHSVSTIDLGDLRRTSPISRDWGYDNACLRSIGTTSSSSCHPAPTTSRGPFSRSKNRTTRDILAPTT